MLMTGFTACSSILSRTNTDKLRMTASKREIIHRKVAFHLGRLCQDFKTGRIHDNDIWHGDEKRLVIHLRLSTMLVFRGEKEVNADVVSGDDGITLLVALNGGFDARLTPSSTDFKNEYRLYPIRNVEDDVPGVSYRSSAKGGMDAYIFDKWLDESRIFKALSISRTRILFVDSCSADKLLETALQRLDRSRTE